MRVKDWIVGAAAIVGMLSAAAWAGGWAGLLSQVVMFSVCVALRAEATELAARVAKLEREGRYDRVLLEADEDDYHQSH